METKLDKLIRRGKLFGDLLFKGIGHNVKGWANVNQYPNFLCFCVTSRCDSRCKACDVWKGCDAKKQTEEMSIEQIEQIFSDRLFRKLKSLNVQGGEATMRADIVEVVETILKQVPSSKEVGLTSNGLDTELLVPRVRGLYEMCRKNGVFFATNFSIDGVGEYHDYARGEKAFERVNSSIEQLADLRKQPGFFLGTNCVLTAKNIENIDEILTYQQKEFGINNLAVVEFRKHFGNTEESPYSKVLSFEDNPSQKTQLVDFLSKHNRPVCFGDFTAYRYEHLRAMQAEGKKRTMSCKYKIASGVLDHQGNLMLCAESEILGNCLEKSASEIYFSANTKRVRKELPEKLCQNCHPYGFYYDEQAKDLLKYIWYYLKTRRNGKDNGSDNGNGKTKRA